MPLSCLKFSARVINHSSCSLREPSAPGSHAIPHCFGAEALRCHRTCHLGKCLRWKSERVYGLYVGLGGGEEGGDTFGLAGNGGAASGSPKEKPRFVDIVPPESRRGKSVKRPAWSRVKMAFVMPRCRSDRTAAHDLQQAVAWYGLLVIFVSFFIGGLQLQSASEEAVPIWQEVIAMNIT
jgi:hypothetical protein